MSKRHGSRPSDGSRHSNGRRGPGRQRVGAAGGAAGDAAGDAAGAARPTKTRDTFVARPFAGLTDEAEWVALREIVPAATTPLRLKAELAEQFGSPEVRIATVLPMAAPAIIQAQGKILLGLQRQVRSGDVSRDLGVALRAALETEPGGTVAVPALAIEGPRLQDLLEQAPLEITLHDSFRFWLDDEAAADPNVAASLERADSAIHPTRRVDGVEAAYWFRMPNRVHLRWVLPDDENAALDALARLSAAPDGANLGEGTRLAGTFRAHGLLIPVWDLPTDSEAERWVKPLADFHARYTEALAAQEPLTGVQRRARAGLVGRQFTLR